MARRGNGDLAGALVSLGLLLGLGVVLRGRGGYGGGRGLVGCCPMRGLGTHEPGHGHGSAAPGGAGVPAAPGSASVEVRSAVTERADAPAMAVAEASESAPVPATVAAGVGSGLSTKVAPGVLRAAYGATAVPITPSKGASSYGLARIFASHAQQIASSLQLSRSLAAGSVVRMPSVRRWGMTGGS